MKGDVKRIRKQIAYLEKLDKQYQPMVTKLNQLAKRYQMRQICELLKPYVEELEDNLI